MASAAALLTMSAPLRAEPLIWGVRVEQLEYRFGDEDDIFAWDFDAIVGTDERQFLWRSEAEFDIDGNAFETLENQARVQTPISDFFDAVIGVRIDTPSGPNRAYGVLGIHGLAPQWFEIDADLFVSDKPFFGLEVEYEALITNRITLIPRLDLDLPFTDDRAIGTGAWGPRLELGARLGYDLLDRRLSPYVGVHYERVFGESADIARNDGEGRDAVFVVTGFRLII